MIKIKPYALLVCGLLATSVTGQMTVDLLKRKISHLSLEKLKTLLDDMVHAGLIEKYYYPDQTTAYYILCKFQAEISS